MQYLNLYENRIEHDGIKTKLHRPPLIKPINLGGPPPLLDEKILIFASPPPLRSGINNERSLAIFCTHFAMNSTPGGQVLNAPIFILPNPNPSRTNLKKVLIELAGNDRAHFSF